MNQVRRFGHERLAEELLDPHVVMRVEIVPWHFHADASSHHAQRLGEPFESRDRIFRLAATPGPKLIDQRIVPKFVSFAVASQHADRPGLGGNQQALKFLIALRVRPGQPANRHRMKDQQPIESRRADRLANAGSAGGEFFGGEIVFGHALPWNARPPVFRTDDSAA